MMRSNDEEVLRYVPKAKSCFLRSTTLLEGAILQVVVLTVPNCHEILVQLRPDFHKPRATLLYCRSTEGAAD